MNYACSFIFCPYPISARIQHNQAGHQWEHRQLDHRVLPLDHRVPLLDPVDTRGQMCLKEPQIHHQSTPIQTYPISRMGWRQRAWSHRRQRRKQIPLLIKVDRVPHRLPMLVHLKVGTTVHSLQMSCNHVTKSTLTNLADSVHFVPSSSSFFIPFLIFLSFVCVYQTHLFHK